ncbi:LOW QUALITY PROTEIN: hypothetical protein Cgig2_000840 [Carnegiea gigantea]|uniref:5'-3' DNA helicase ZGRF1-like N-terminal domain-containing protein n=1 Tax=Carnegiea gigantea TaxID=171969 RepID=A0A9Q1GR74_9CARY|nr:LOW QUALITY PROTEIN: hypothetical protein Cgig2_000840 [Carnegiea gigantea]
MGEVRKKWSVTYTKHVKQKRKVYQDGILHLLSNNKMMLYDESEQLLDSRFLTKDEVVESGESLSFTCFLVDIGDPKSNQNIISCPNPKSEYDDRTKEKTQLQHGKKLTTHRSKGYKLQLKLNISRRKTLASNISPSQMIIREFKKNEQFKYEVQQTRSPPSATNSSFTEWEALYTTQITQKAKKYHDGFICVIACGSQGRQVILYDSSKNQLDKRFLKKDEVVGSGESLAFDAYLVDIGDCVRNKEHDTDVKLHGKNCKMTERRDTMTGQQWHKSFADNLGSDAQRIKVIAQQDQFKVGKSTTTEKPQHTACSSKHINCNLGSLGAEKMKLGKTDPSHMHLRDGPYHLKFSHQASVLSFPHPSPQQASLTDFHSSSTAHQILSILRNPAATDRTLIVQEAPAKQCPSRHPELVQFDSKSQEFQGSHPQHQHASGMAVEKCKDKKTENEGCTRTLGDDSQSETGRNDLSAPTGSHNNNKARPVCTQGIEAVKSHTLVGSALIDRLRAAVDHGTAVIQDSRQGKCGHFTYVCIVDPNADFSPVKSEAGTHHDQHRTTLSEAYPKSEGVSGPNVDEHKPNCSANDHSNSSNQSRLRLGTELAKLAD